MKVSNNLPMTDKLEKREGVMTFVQKILYVMTSIRKR